MAQQPTIQQTIEGHGNVQLGVVHGCVHVMHVYPPPPVEPHRERAMALRGMALAPITAGISMPDQPALSLGLLAAGAVVALLPNWLAAFGRGGAA